MLAGSLNSIRSGCLPHVNVFSVALEVVTTVLYSPKPVLPSAHSRSTVLRQYSHVVLVKANANLVALSVTGVVSA
jgi:hypothetical protein